MKNTLSGFGEIDLQADKSRSDTTNSNTFDQYNNLKDLSQDKATQMLYDQVKKQKQNGTFNFQDLQNKVNALKDYLPAGDFANLQKLLESLR